jgi:hypothetical protein
MGNMVGRKVSALPIPEPYRAPFCKVPLSFFYHFMGIENGAQLSLFCVILAETIGDRPGNYWAEIPNETFAKYTGVSTDWVSTALDSLENGYHWIKSRKNSRGRREYSIDDRYILEVEEAGLKKRPGRCSNCKTVEMFDTRYVKVPHVALRKLGGCVGPAAFKCIMTVILRALDWKDGLWETKRTELDFNDFHRLSGLENREISNGIAEAVKLGLIGRELRSGKQSLYWINMKAFESLERRPARKVSPPARGVEGDAKSPTKKLSKNPVKPAETHANELGNHFYSRCPKCKVFVDVEPVTEAELIPKEPEKPPRAGPGRAKRSPSQVSLDRSTEKMKQMYPHLFPGDVERVS